VKAKVILLLSSEGCEQLAKSNPQDCYWYWYIRPRAVSLITDSGEEHKLPMADAEITPGDIVIGETVVLLPGHSQAVSAAVVGLEEEIAKVRAESALELTKLMGRKQELLAISYSPSES